MHDATRQLLQRLQTTAATTEAATQLERQSLAAAELWARVRQELDGYWLAQQLLQEHEQDAQHATTALQQRTPGLTPATFDAALETLLPFG